MQNQIVIEQQVSGEQMSLFEIEAKAQSLMERVQRLKDDSRTKREMIKTTLENDSEWSETVEQIKELQRRKKTLESNHNEIIALKEDVKEITGERKEVEQSLSTYLEAYHYKSGKSEIKDATGETKPIKKSYRV